MNSVQDLLAEGFPHSDIRGSTIARISPRLFAACHVLHRLLAPRHPPNALLSLHIHTTARAQGQNTTPRYYLSRAAAPASSPGRGQVCPRTMCVTRTHNNSSSSPCERTCSSSTSPGSLSRIPDNAAWTGFGSVATPSGQPTRPSQPSPPRTERHRLRDTAPRCYASRVASPCLRRIFFQANGLKENGDGRIRTDDPLLAKQVLSH